jgi:hypothetical protein
MVQLSADFGGSCVVWCWGGEWVGRGGQHEQAVKSHHDTNKKVLGRRCEEPHYITVCDAVRYNIPARRRGISQVTKQAQASLRVASNRAG